jgi:FkbM family methyltransferase
MKYFIDLGTYNGKFLEDIVETLPPFDKYIGFEPIHELYIEAKERFKNNSKVEIKELAADVSSCKDVKCYIGYSKKRGKKAGIGSTLLQDKSTGHIREEIFAHINTIDFSKYLFENFKEDDHITLKVNIEGKEYDLLEHLLDTGSMKYIDVCYVEWHVSKFKKNKKINKERHANLVERLGKSSTKLNKLKLNLKVQLKKIKMERSQSKDNE